MMEPISSSLHAASCSAVRSRVRSPMRIGPLLISSTKPDRHIAPASWSAHSGRTEPAAKQRRSSPVRMMKAKGARSAEAASMASRSIAAASGPCTASAAEAGAESMSAWERSPGSDAIRAMDGAGEQDATTRLFALGRQSIADAPDGLQRGQPAGAQLAPEVADVDRQRVRLGWELLLPHVVLKRRG